MYLDTHVVVWLYARELEKFPETLINRLNNERLIISPLVILELEYLYEIKRIKQQGIEIINTLATDVNLEICHLPYEKIVHVALKQTWTRDPFDRLIVAQAAVNQLSTSFAHHE